MENIFRLYWRRESGCDDGTIVSLEDLEAVLRSRVLELATEISSCSAIGSENSGGPIEIRLPFLDKREWKRRSETLRTIQLERHGRVIRYVPTSASATLRDLAADTAGGHPAWLAAPVERRPGYFRTWRTVSVALQEFLRRRATEIYFRDVSAFEDRKAAWPLLVYQAMRPCYGIPETEFTYDIADAEMLDEALRLIRRPLQEILTRAQTRLAESGRMELSRRYSPVWHEDIVRAVAQKPRKLLSTLGDEALLVDAVIALGATRNLATVKPFARRVMATLRSFYDIDMRDLAVPLLEEATRALEVANATEPKYSAPRRRPQAIASRPAISTLPVISRLPQVETRLPSAAASTYGRYRLGNAALRS